MKTRGREVLYALRDLEQDPRTSTWILSGDVARRLGRKDGRAVTPTLEDLERCGLVQRWPDPAHLWRTTERGREVEKILSAADAHRGGEFAPLVNLPLSVVERWAVAR